MGIICIISYLANFQGFPSKCGRGRAHKGRKAKMLNDRKCERNKKNSCGSGPLTLALPLCTLDLSSLSLFAVYCALCLLFIYVPAQVCVCVWVMLISEANGLKAVKKYLLKTVMCEREDDAIKPKTSLTGLAQTHE